MNKKRILFVNHTAVMGGGELSLLDLATAYRDNSKVLLLNEGPFHQRLKANGVKVEVAAGTNALLQARSSGGLEAVKLVPALIVLARQIAQKAQSFDLVHANSQKAFVAAALATWFGSPAPIWHLRDIITAKHYSSINRRLAVSLANRCAAKVIVNSQATGAAFVEAGGKSELVEVVYNGFNPEAFKPSQTLSSVRQELGLGEQVALVGVFSRLSPWKGQHILLEALRQLPNVHGLIVGKALFGEQDYTEMLQSLASVPELAGRIHWLGFQENIPQLMAACNIIAHTSTEPEPFGRVIIEGHLARKPVIATAAGGAVELIEPEVTGKLVPPGDAQALAKAIEDLLDAPQTTARITQQAYDLACDRFSLSVMLETFDRIIQSV